MRIGDGLGESCPSREIADRKLRSIEASELLRDTTGNVRDPLLFADWTCTPPRVYGS